MALNPPPVSQPVIAGNNFLNSQWINWFNTLYQEVKNGVVSQTWSPNFIGASLSGNISITGRYWKIGDLLQFHIYVSGGAIKIPAGSTCNNLPYTAVESGVVTAFDVEANIRISEGSIEPEGKVMNLPVIGTTVNNLVFVGMVRVS